MPFFAFSCLSNRVFSWTISLFEDTQKDFCIFFKCVIKTFITLIDISLWVSPQIKLNYNWSRCPRQQDRKSNITTSNKSSHANAWFVMLVVLKVTIQIKKLYNLVEVAWSNDILIEYFDRRTTLLNFVNRLPGVHGSFTSGCRSWAAPCLMTPYSFLMFRCTYTHCVCRNEVFRCTYL